MFYPNDPPAFKEHLVLTDPECRIALIDMMRQCAYDHNYNRVKEMFSSYDDMPFNDDPDGFSHGPEDIALLDFEAYAEPNGNGDSFWCSLSYGKRKFRADYGYNATTNKSNCYQD